MKTRQAGQRIMTEEDPLIDDLKCLKFRFETKVYHDTWLKFAFFQGLEYVQQIVMTFYETLKLDLFKNLT